MASTDKKPELEKEILRLEGSDAESFLNYMKRDRTPEIRSYKEADEFYKSKCTLNDCLLP